MRDPSTIPQSVHIIGAGGSGMSGLAKLLSQLGHGVTGSDVKPGRMLDALADVGVRTWIGHDPEAAVKAGLVVCSSAVPSNDPELRAAVEAGIETWRRPRLLNALTEASPAIGLAGTHGKTTSTALAVAALRGSGVDPSFLVGGELVGLNTGAHMGEDDAFVLEADEAFGTFRHLVLRSIMVTNIEADHLDHYGTVSAMEDAFAQVVSRVSLPGIGCIDDAGVRRLAQRTSIETYGFNEDADWRIANMEHSPDGSRFRVEHADGALEVSLPKPGNHLAANATGVLALLHQNGFDVERAATALSEFSGVRRRYEVKARVNGVTVVDDYAHHPTEVAATISAASQGSDGRVVVVFQPHRYTRTADLGPEFGDPLALADEVLVTDVYAAGERPIIGVSGRLVAQSAEAAGGRVSYIPKLSDIPDRLVQMLDPGDTVLLLGAGDITSISGDVARALEETL